MMLTASSMLLPCNIWDLLALVGRDSCVKDARLLYTLELQKHNNAKSDNGELILFGIPFFTDNFTTFVSLCCEESFEVSFSVPSC